MLNAIIYVLVILKNWYTTTWFEVTIKRRLLVFAKFRPRKGSSCFSYSVWYHKYMDKTHNYILGLDIGIASVGWSVINKDKNRIEDMGVRLFEIAETPKEGDSLNKLRREKRSQRRSKSYSSVSNQVVVY